MADVNLYAIKLPLYEGGVVNNPNDHGGATFCGVTLHTFIGYRRQKRLPIPTVDDLKHISHTEWLDVLKTLFWDEWQADKILNQSVGESCVEFFWGSGWAGIKIPQRLLGVVPDGNVGEKTIAAVNAQDPQVFHEQLRQAKIHFIDGIVHSNPSQQIFYKGWLRRINAFTYQP